jgi:hypothetical protein
LQDNKIEENVTSGKWKSEEWIKRSGKENNRRKYFLGPERR